MKFKAGLTRFLLYSVLVLFFAASAFAASFFTESVANADGFSAEGISAYLVDATTGRELYAKNENERLPVASMVKLMTALLTLEAEERGELSYDEDITVNDQTTANDIEDWDSLEHINLMAAVESEFGIKFSMGQVVTMKNVGEMADIILQKVQKG